MCEVKVLCTCTVNWVVLSGGAAVPVSLTVYDRYQRAGNYGMVQENKVTATYSKHVYQVDR